MALNQLGPFTFLDMSSPPELVLQHVVSRVRAGANGVLMQRLGFWGEPFEVVTKAGFATFAQAELERDDYRSLVGEAQELTYGGIPFLAAGHLYVPRAVHPIRTRRIVRGVAPDGSAYFAETVVRWELQPVTIGNN